MGVGIYPQPGPPTEGRLPPLDGLRGLAVLGVLIGHFAPFPCPSTAAWMGVNLFFVLSGFLITRILLQQRDATGDAARGLWPTLGVFYSRRALRIFPLYFAALAVALVCGVPEARRGVWWLATYTYNWYAAAGRWGGPVSHFWSLCVEEQFYLVWPFFILLCPRRVLPWAIGAVFLVGPAWRVGCLLHGTNRHPPAIATLGVLDPLAAGAFLAWCESRGRQALARSVAIARPVGVVLLGVWLVTWLQAHPWTLGRVSIDVLIGNTAMAVLFAAVVGRATGPVGGDWGAVLTLRGLRYLGTISYGVYVIHLFVPKMWAKVAPAVPWLAIEPVYAHFALSLLLGAASWHLFEKPIQDLKRYLPYATPPEPIVAARRAA